MLSAQPEASKENVAALDQQHPQLIQDPEGRNQLAMAEDQR